MADNLIKRIRTDKGDCQIDYNSLANRPSSMKNPYALTFSGAASSSYDGTAPVNVRIPPIPTWADRDTNPSYTKSESDNKYATKQDSDEKYAAADQTYTKDETDARYAPISAAIRPTVTGNPAVCEDSAAWAFQGLKVYGKSTQNGTPSPENPVPIVSAGEGGSVSVLATGENICAKSVSSTGNFASGVKLKKDTNYTLCAIQSPNNTGFHVRLYSENGAGELIESITCLADDTKWKNGYFNFTTKNTGWLSINSFANSEWDKIALYYGTVSENKYSEYHGNSLTISTPNGLPGIPVDSGGTFTDADGQQWICDVKDYGTGKYTQNCVSAVFDGSEDENWTESSSFPKRYVARNISPNVLPFSSGLCSQYIVTAKENESGSQDVSFVNVLKQFCVNTSYATLNEWKLHLTQNPMIVVLRTTPIETPLSSEELAAYKALATYDGTTVVSTAEDVAGIEASYVADGTKYLQSVTDRIAALEAAQTSI